jgi:HEAT repeat protein
VRAARLLGALRAEASIRPLLALMLECDPMEMLYSAAIHALQELGEAAVEPALAALPADTLQQRIAVCEVLAGLEERDPRILAALTALVQEDPEMGASFLATYGDAAAIPALVDAFDRYELRRADVAVYGDRPFIELTEAIKALGGTFNESQLRKIRRADRWLDEARSELIARRETSDQAIGPPRPGRNDPCWCGSDRKYKKCHLVSDGPSSASDP